MIEEVGCDRLRVFFDTQNYHVDRNYHEADILNGISDNVAQIHVKDGFNGTVSSALLGTGDASFMETAEAIKRSKCTEWLLIENFYHWKPLREMNDDMFILLEEDIRKLHEIFDRSFA